MINFSGVTVCFCVSLWCAPATNYIMEHKLLSNVLPMYIMQYSMFLTALSLFVFVLKPSQVFGNLEKQGSALYFMCCMFTCISISQLAVHSRRYNVFGKSKPLQYFASDEPHLKTPFGMSSELSHCVVTYVMSLLMVFRMDNKLSPRDLALYWCGFTVTKTLVTGLSLLSGPFVTKLRCNSYINLFFFVISLWLMYYFLMKKPRTVPCYRCFARSNAVIDTVIALLLAFSAVFSFIRILCVLNSNQKYIKRYNSLEPYMKNKSNFGASWILICGFFSIPCCLLGILSLCQSLTKRSLNMALLHAGSILQGTFVYISFNWYVNADKKGKIPLKYYYVVSIFNLLLVVAAHAYMMRCLWKHVPLMETRCSRCFSDSEKEEVRAKRTFRRQKKEKMEDIEDVDDDDGDDDDDDDDDCDECDEDEGDDYCCDQDIASEEDDDYNEC